MSSKRNLSEVPADVPTGEDNDNSYVSRSGHKGEEIPVVSDQERIEDPIDADVADSDEQLERDDNDAIDTDNIIDERTRGAEPREGYAEPGDEEGLPGPEDGTSSN